MPEKGKTEGMRIYDRPPRYSAYLLRCWEVRSDCPGQPRTWRFSVEAAGTGERRGLASLEALVAYLAQELEHEDAGAPSAQDKEKE